jgi:colanic acid/amylovoran biosynthesis glycosyltransferase
VSHQPRNHESSNGRSTGDPAAVAYITTRYPSISHTFVLREVQALRDRGVDVHTVSIHQADGEHLLSDANRRALESTYAIRPPRWRHVLGAHARAALSAPRAYAATLRCALGLARPGLRGRIWQLFYFAEAIVLWRHCTKVGARHIHAHHGSPPADVALLAARCGALSQLGPATWSMTVHGPTEFWNTRWYRLAEKIERADGVVCISEFARSQVMALVSEQHWAKLEVVHCGLIAERYHAPALAELDRRQILCVGRLVPEKGQAVLIKALGRVRDAGHDVDLVLVGSGPGEAELMRLAARLDLIEHVIFAGAVGQDEIERHYCRASVFCSSSFSEGLPVVLMEALAHGRPAVATAIAGVRELIRDGETGLLVSPGRADELAEAISRLLDDDQLSRRLADNGRRHVAREFDVRRSAAQLDGFFAQIMATKRGAGANRAPHAPPPWQDATVDPEAEDSAIEPPVEAQLAS